MILDHIKKTSLIDLLALITPCLILTGFSQKIGFYSSENINAYWMVSLFSPIDLMISSLEIYMYYLLALIYLEKVIVGKESLKMGLINSNLVLFGSFVGIFFVTDYAFKYYLYAASSLNLFALAFFGNYSGKFVGLLGLMLAAPAFAGLLDAGEIAIQKKPLVELDASLENKNWYLLDKYSDKAILVSRDKGTNYFKIVEMKDIKFIESAAK